MKFGGPQLKMLIQCVSMKIVRNTDEEKVVLLSACSGLQIN